MLLGQPPDRSWNQSSHDHRDKAWGLWKWAKEKSLPNPKAPGLGSSTISVTWSLTTRGLKENKTQNTSPNYPEAIRQECKEPVFLLAALKQAENHTTHYTINMKTPLAQQFHSSACSWEKTTHVEGNTRMNKLALIIMRKNWTRPKYGPTNYCNRFIQWCTIQ